MIWMLVDPEGDEEDEDDEELEHRNLLNEENYDERPVEVENLYKNSGEEPLSIDNEYSRGFNYSGLASDSNKEKKGRNMRASIKLKSGKLD